MSPQTTPTVESLLQRLQAMEQANRYWRWGSLVCAAGLAVAVAFLFERQPPAAASPPEFAEKGSAIFTTVEAGAFLLRNPAGVVQGRLAVVDGAPYLVLSKADDGKGIVLSYSQSGPGIAVSMKGDGSGVFIAPSGDGHPAISFVEPWAKTRMLMGSLLDGAYLKMFDAADHTRVLLSQGDHGEFLTLFGSNQKQRIGCIQHDTLGIHLFVNDEAGHAVFWKP